MATTCGVIRWKCEGPRFEVCWPKLALACASTSIWKATARPSSPMCARWASRVSSQSGRARPTVRALAGLAQVEEPSVRSGEARGRGGLGAMTGREHLAQADRFIAECKNRIARQCEIIATAYENGHSTDIPVSMLRALEENLRSFERHRHLILDQLKNSDRQRLARTASRSSVRN